MASFSLDSTIHVSTTSSPPSPPELRQSPASVIHVPVTMAPPAAAATDYSARSQWLRATVLGANDGLVSVASLIIGVGAINQSSRAMLVSGLAGLIAGACSMAIGEYVSVYTQYDIEMAHLRRQNSIAGVDKKSDLPSPGKAAAASALSFALGAILPLLAGSFIKSWGVRVAVVGAVSSVGLAGFGSAGAVLGGAAAVGKAAVRVLVGGLLAMVVTYGVLRLFGLAFNMNVSGL